VIEPLPRWAKGFVAVVGAGLLAVVVTGFLDDGLGDPHPAAWHVDPSANLGPTTREVSVIVHELTCSSGRSAEGRIVTEVTHDADTVRIDIGVRPFGGDQNCQSSPDTPFVVELDEPLGSRTIVGERWPP
jgi:hypothetical protein